MEELKQIEIDKIQNLENVRLRVEEDDLQGLMQDIKQRGLLQPIGVIEDNENRYWIQFGNRRLNACKKLGWKTIPAKVVKKQIDFDSFLADNVAENIERKDITPMELGRICNYYLQKDYSIGEISEKLTEPVHRIKAALLLYDNVPEEYKDAVAYVPPGQKTKGKISAKAATKIVQSRMIGKEKKMHLFDYAKKHELSTEKINFIQELINKNKKLSVAQAFELSKEYKIMTVHITVKKIELEKSDNFTTYIRKILRKEILNWDSDAYY